MSWRTLLFLAALALLWPAAPVSADTIVLDLFDVTWGTPCPYMAADGVVFVNAFCDYLPGSDCSDFESDPFWGLFLGNFVALLSLPDVVAVEVDAYDSCAIHCTRAELYAGETLVASAMNETAFAPVTFHLDAGGQPVTRLCVRSMEGFLREIRIVTAAVPPPNDTMAGATGLSGGDFDSDGDTSGAGDDSDPAPGKTCGPAAGPDVFYTFALEPGDSFTADLVADTFAEAVYVLEVGGTCVAYAADGGGKAVLQYVNPGPNAQEYYLVVDGVGPTDAGPFHLTGTNGGFDPLPVTRTSWGSLKERYF